jgi:hypothetical protein
LDERVISSEIRHDDDEEAAAGQSAVDVVREDDSASSAVHPHNTLSGAHAAPTPATMSDVLSDQVGKGTDEEQPGVGVGVGGGDGNVEARSSPGLAATSEKSQDSMDTGV